MKTGQIQSASSLWHFNGCTYPKLNCLKNEKKKKKILNIINILSSLILVLQNCSKKFKPIEVSIFETNAL
jgi:hypothetical protein